MEAGGVPGHAITAPAADPVEKRTPRQRTARRADVRLGDILKNSSCEGMLAGCGFERAVSRPVPLLRSDAGVTQDTQNSAAFSARSPRGDFSVKAKRPVGSRVPAHARSLHVLRFSPIELVQRTEVPRTMRPLATAALLLSLAADHVGAATFAVLNTNDSGPGSLRQAIEDSNSIPGTDTITFGPAATDAILLASPLPTLTDHVSLLGPGAGVLRIDGNGAFRVLDIGPGLTVILSGLSISNGRVFAPETGAGINISGSGLTLIGCTFSGNVADGSGARGGGIRNDGFVTIIDSTFSDNSALGVLSSGGAIDNNRTLRIT